MSLCLISEVYTKLYTELYPKSVLQISTHYTLFHIKPLKYKDLSSIRQWQEVLYREMVDNKTQGN